MTNRRSTSCWLPIIAACCLGLSTARASDIDIYGGVAPTGVNPNVLILIDNASSNNAAFASTCAASATWTTGKLMDAVTCALYTALQKVGQQTSLLGKLNVGLMDYGAQDNQGGQWIIPAAAPASLPTMDAAGIGSALTLLTNLNANSKATSNSRAAPSVFQESWAFFTGGRGLSGTSYADHITLSCQKSFIIFIGAAAKQGHPAEGNGNADLTGTTANAAQKVQINTSGLGPYTGEDVAWTDEWARYLRQGDFDGSDGSQNITTYTIAATGGDPAPDYVQHLKSVANQGGGKAFVAANINDIVQALLQIFNEVQAVNSVFASSSLPVSVNTQGTYENQVFIGMFRPEANGLRRWHGNLKQYQFGVDKSNPANPKLFLADSTGAQAISGAGTGFISPNAISFWTTKDTSKSPDASPPTGPGGFWVNDPQGVGDAFDSPDGELVEKGGVGQQLRLATLKADYTATPGTTNNPRNLYTCTGSCGAGSSLSSYPFATTNASLTSSLLGLDPIRSTVSSISRLGNTVTMALSAAPTPALVNGQSVTVAGSAYPELNGTFTIALVDTRTFTYTISETPPATAAGTYTTTRRGTIASIASLTRSGTTVTATAYGHGYVTGQRVLISRANGTEYNGNYAITVLDANRFTYTIADGPASPGGGGTATLGLQVATIVAGSGIVRQATAADNTATVTVTATANLANGFVVGAKVTISGAAPTAYNVTNATITGVGNSCPGGSNKKSFCFKIATTPASPDGGGNPRADSTYTTATLSSLTHAPGCTGTSPSRYVTATATIATLAEYDALYFASQAGDRLVDVTGSPVGPNEAAYVDGPFDVTFGARSAPYRFTYTITTSPPCYPMSSGVTVATNAAGIDRVGFIRWVRGEDNVGDELSPGYGVTVRPSVHGDVLHSRPTIINYGGATGPVVFYGANDGTLRAVNGKQSGSIGSTPPGGELWSFLPVEFATPDANGISRLKNLYLNSPSIKLYTTPDGLVPTPTPKDYFFDGVTGAYVKSHLDSSKNTVIDAAYIFPSARRGGRLLYAIDVTTPANPKFMWKKGCPNFGDNTGCDTGFEELGQTWSQPKPAIVKGSTNPVVILGAGYDASEDTEPPGTDTMGRGIYVLDATNGNILWRAAAGGSVDTCTGTPCTLKSMTYAVAADVTLVDRDGDGYIDRVYAADTGGSIWRVDLEPAAGTAPANWQVTRLAAVGGSGTTRRKFLYPPDVVAAPNFDIVVAATGDREHPMYGNASLAIVNRFYGIKDVKGKDASGSATVVDNTSATGNDAPAGLFNASAGGTFDASAASGYFITLPNAGEKGVNAPLTIGQYTYFSTNTPPQPSALSCATNLGTARGYRVNYFTGAWSSGIFDGGGLPPSPIAGIVKIGTSGAYPFAIGALDPTKTLCVGPDCKSAIGAIEWEPNYTPSRRRVYWYMQNHDK